MILEPLRTPNSNCPSCIAKTLHDSTHKVEDYKKYHPTGGYAFMRGSGQITYEQFLEKLEDVRKANPS